MFATQHKQAIFANMSATNSNLLSFSLGAAAGVCACGTLYWALQKQAPPKAAALRNDVNGVKAHEEPIKEVQPPVEPPAAPAAPEDRPADAPESCPGVSSEQAGKSASCAGCPNQALCASGEAKKKDPAVADVQDRLRAVKRKILVLSGEGWGWQKHSPPHSCLSDFRGVAWTWVSWM